MSNSASPTTTVTDPVCGMTIDPSTAADSLSRGGGTYYFCSRVCRALFEVPAKRSEPLEPASSCCSKSGCC